MDSAVDRHGRDHRATAMSDLHIGERHRVEVRAPGIGNLVELLGGEQQPDQ